MITISGVCPLFFRVIGENGALPDYVQKFHSSDTILLQLFSNDGEVPSALLNNKTENTSSAISFSTYQVNDSVMMYYASLSGLNEAKYTVTANGFESVPFCIDASDKILSETVLVRYSHKDNTTAGYAAVFWIENVQQFFEFRMEGGFKPSGIAQKVSTEQFRNQFQELANIYAVPYKTFVFTGGDNAHGLPYWFAELLNRALCLSDTEIDGVQYVRSEGSEPAITPIMEGLQAFNITISLEKKVNDAFGISFLPSGYVTLDGQSHQDINASISGDTTTYAVVSKDGYGIDQPIYKSGGTDWCIPTIRGNNVDIYVRPNADQEPRETTIIIYNDYLGSATIQVHQDGTPTQRAQ
jgi:hypothetical protein